MLIRVFPPHYQLVYINFDISSFSVISYTRCYSQLHCIFTNITLENYVFMLILLMNTMFLGFI